LSWEFILLYDLFIFLLIWCFFLRGVVIRFNVETVQYNNIKFQVWDLGK
jgi:hypothetical protein